MTDTQTITGTKHFSSLSDLVAASFNLAKLSLKNLVLISLSAFVLTIAFSLIISVVMVGIGIAGAAVFTNIGSGGGFIATASVFIAIYMLSMFVWIFFSLAYAAAYMLAIAKADEKPSVGYLLTTGFKFIPAMFTTNFLVGFLIVGGFNLLIVPGIIIAVYLSFASYEVVLNGQKNLQALKNSVIIVSQNFGELFIRYLVMMGIGVVIGAIYVTLEFFFKNDSTLTLILNFVFLIVQTVLTCLSIAYVYIIYKEARDLTDFTQPVKITWMWIVATLGWILGAVAVAASIIMTSGLAKSGAGQDLLMQGMQGLDSETSTDSATMMDYESIMSEDGETVDTDALIDMYGSELSDEDKEMMRSIIESSQEPSN